MELWRPLRSSGKSFMKISLVFASAALLAGFHASALAQSQPAIIVAQPISQTALQGQSVTFTVAAGGSAPLFYQWRHGSNNLGSGASLMLTNVSPSQTDTNYLVQVS